MLCGRMLSAADVAELVPLLAAAMNAGQDEFVPQSLFRQVEQRRADAAVRQLLGPSTRGKETCTRPCPCRCRS